MYSSEECRKRAQYCVELAQDWGPAMQVELLKLARGWLLLADQYDEITRLDVNLAAASGMTKPPPETSSDS